MSITDAQYAIQELSEKLDAVIAAGIKGVVKQVAHGTYDFVSNDRSSGKTITTGVTVNPSKTVVLLNSRISSTLAVLPTGSNEHRDVMQSILTAKTDTTITVSANYARFGSVDYTYGTVSWQLIEFY